MHISHNILQLGHQDILIILHVHQTKNIFQTIIFFLYYSPCPNLEGIKDALFYKFRRPTIGQNCSAVCTNKGGYRNGAKRRAFREACSAGY